MPDYGVGSWPRRRSRINPGGVALRQAGRALTYGELADRVDLLARALAAHGIGHGDRVAYLGLNDIATFETLFAAGRLGAIFVPLNTRLAPNEITSLLDDAGPGALEAGEDLPPVTAEVELGDDAVILYTSGTTGRPRGAVLSHANLTFNTMNQFAHADILSSDTVLCMSPLFHATGLGQVSLPTIFKGGTVVVAPDLSSLRYVIYGGSMVAERVAVAWQHRGVHILQGYGMTEASPGVYLAVPDGAAERPVSIGLPHFFTDVSIAPLDGQQPGAGSGELLVRGLNVSSGYWHRPAEDAAAFPGGWFHSGDVIRVADDGWAYVVDRIKDIIISGGENIYPAEVENRIASLPGIMDCALIGVPDTRWGEVGMAFVVVSSPGAWTEPALRDALRSELAAFKLPKYVRFVDHLPRTATGKTRKQDLRIIATSEKDNYAHGR